MRFDLQPAQKEVKDVAKEVQLVNDVPRFVEIVQSPMLHLYQLEDEKDQGRREAQSQAISNLCQLFAKYLINKRHNEERKVTDEDGRKGVLRR